MCVLTGLTKGVPTPRYKLISRKLQEIQENMQLNVRDCYAERSVAMVMVKLLGCKVIRLYFYIPNIVY